MSSPLCVSEEEIPLAKDSSNSKGLFSRGDHSRPIPFSLHRKNEDNNDRATTSSNRDSSPTLKQQNAVKMYLTNIIYHWTPSDRVYWVFIYSTMPILLWGALFFIIGDAVYPGGTIFPLIFLLFTGIALGMVFEMIKIPPLLAMLIMGIAARNEPHIAFCSDLSSDVSASIRQLALVVILIRAGLGLDPVALMKLKGVVIRLAFCPCLFEATAVAIATHYVPALSFPWTWGFLLGFVLAAVSPAVTVPCLLSLQERGYGVEKGIPTMVIAAASVDDILAISLFGLTLGSTFSQESFVKTMLKGPMELLLGILFALVWGGVTGVFVSTTKVCDKSAVFKRAVYCLLGSCVAVFGFHYAQYPGAGALGCLGAVFISAVIWRKKQILHENESLNLIFAQLWYVFQPLLFGLIGCEIDLDSVDMKIVGWGIFCLFIGLTVRLIVTFVVVGNSGLSLKERIFVAMAWLPKATVQAAIGSVALDTARKLNFGETEVHLGLQVLTMAIISILITAPIGAVIIMLFGPKLLEKQRNSTAKLDQELIEVGTGSH